MALKRTNPATNGKGARKSRSWIESFVEQTEGLEAPIIFRRWAAITTIASVLEQKVWITTTSDIPPNLYTFLIGHPGTGKTRVVREARKYLQEIPDFHFAPTSLTEAALIDALVERKRTVVRMPKEPLEYNTMTLTADEFGAFMHEYDRKMVAVLSAFYDPDPYLHERRGKEIRIKIKKPQLNMLCGSTPSNLIKFMPEIAWDQGFTSRIIFVYSDEKTIGDDFNIKPITLNSTLVHDLKVINSLIGEFTVLKEFSEAILSWRQLGELPLPTHPKLIHYNTRRKVHLYKLSMVASADRGDDLTLTKADFDTAFNWLCEAETRMPEIFRAGTVGADAKVMEEIEFYIRSLDKGAGVNEDLIMRFAGKIAPANTIYNILKIMEHSGTLSAVSQDPKTKLRKFRTATPEERATPLLERLTEKPTSTS